MDKKMTLEHHRIFPYIAWATVISFALFTYTLAMDLQEDLNHLDQQVSVVESSVHDMKSDRNSSASELTE